MTEDPRLKGLREQMERAQERAKDSNPNILDRRRAAADVQQLQGMINRVTPKPAKQQPKKLPAKKRQRRSERQPPNNKSGK